MKTKLTVDYCRRRPARLAVSGLAGAATDAASLNALAARPASGDEFLDPEEAFRLAVTPEGPDRVRLHWTIAPGYYLYRDRIKVATTTPGRDARQDRLSARHHQDR